MDFTYNDIKIDDCLHKISPSQIDSFASTPSKWYREQLLGESGFEGNTASELGNVVHAIAESITKTGDYSDSDVLNYLYTLGGDIDIQYIRENYIDMVRALTTGYLDNNKPTEAELQMYCEVKDKVYVGGTADFIDSSDPTNIILGDYKTVSRKPSGDKMTLLQKRQLMAYAHMYKKCGYGTINTLRIVYVVRPTKTLPVRVIVVDHKIEFLDEEWIDNVLELIAESILLSDSTPTLRHIIWKDMRLKEGRKMTLVNGSLCMK